MPSFISDKTEVTVRPVQYRDFEAVERLLAAELVDNDSLRCLELSRQLSQVRQWYALLKLLSLFPNQQRHRFQIYVAEQGQQIAGLIQVAPFNATRSTWRVNYLMANPTHPCQGVGNHLLRTCFEQIWEARTWLTEINVNDNSLLGLYRQNGFQPLAQLTYWDVRGEQLQTLAKRTPDLPNLLPISNADAGLLYQLDTAAMPPLVRQVFDRHMGDFRSQPLQAMTNWQGWFHRSEISRAYVFEPQRKAAIGYYCLRLSADVNHPHVAELTVHPAYTWLYPELLAQMARITQATSNASLQLVSTDYQPEREACLEQIGAERIEHTLMMSRSVWHKVRESRSLSLEGLQLGEVWQGFQPNRKPVPGRLSPNPSDSITLNPPQINSQPEIPNP
jgi:ribosomal protein S18 acetylase RimI-like enzyme